MEETRKEIVFPAGPDSLYPTLRKRLLLMVEGITDTIANLANVSALLKMTLWDTNWVGFYFRRGDKLILGPFQGDPACVEIPLGKGVCGTAAATKQCIRVEDVHRFRGHIACDPLSRSEIVLPLFKDGEVVAVLDIDSPRTGRFTLADEEGLKSLLPILEELL